MDASLSIVGTRSIREYLARILTYDHRANVIVLEAFAEVGGVLPQKPLARMCHIIAAKQIWLARLGAALPLPETVFPLWPLEEARLREEEVAQTLWHQLEAFSDDDLQQPFSYRSTEGVPFQTIRGDAFAHLALHGAYHRGQIAIEINPLRDAPLATDFILFVRDQK